MKKTLKNINITLISQLVLSLIVLLIGILVMAFKRFGLVDINLYVSLLFYIYAFFSIIAYFIKRKEDDYELLLLSLINIITATFVYVFREDNLSMILGGAMCMYTVLLVINRGYKVVVLSKENSYMWIIKFIVTFLIAFLGILTASNLFNDITVQTLLFGYYFISLGFMLTMENVIEMVVTEEAFKRILYKIVKDDEQSPSDLNLEEIKKELDITPIEVKEEKVSTKKKVSKPKTTATSKKSTTKKTAPKTKKTEVLATSTKTQKSASKKTTSSTKTKTQTKRKVGRPKKTK